MKPTTSGGHTTSTPAPKNRSGRKRHGYRPNRRDDRRGSGDSTLAREARRARAAR